MSLDCALSMCNQAVENESAQAAIKCLTEAEQELTQDGNWVRATFDVSGLPRSAALNHSTACTWLFCLSPVMW